MSACQDFREWVTKTMLVPTTEFITEARNSCNDVGKWVDENIGHSVERWESRQEKRCRKLPWWNPLRWLCALVMVAIKIVDWVVVTTSKWVVTVICQLVTVVVGFFTKLVLSVLGWFVTVVVCLFSEPLEALKSFRDLWSILTDAVDDVFDIAGLLLGDIAGFLEDIENLLDSLGDSLGWLGVILGFFKGIFGLIRGWILIVKDALRAFGDIVHGVLNLNLCAIQGGLADLGTAAARVLLTTGFAAAFIWSPWLAAILLGIRTVGAGIGGIRDTVERIALEQVITNAINAAFGSGSGRATRSLEAVGIGAAPMGLPFRADARRLYISSDSRIPQLRELHKSGVINLYALAGYISDCRGTVNEPVGEVVYARTNLRVSYADLETFLHDGPFSVPEFHVFAITREHFQLHLDTAQRKASHLGIQLSWNIGTIKATSAQHVPLFVDDPHADPPCPKTDDHVQQELFAEMGRTGTARDDLATIPAISHFHYAVDNCGNESFGLTSWWRPSIDDSEKSGVTYRNRRPDWVFEWVLIHEFGHYWGLNHLNRADGDRDVSEIMQRQNYSVTIKLLAEYLLLGGEPRFTHEDALTVWDWITKDGAASLLP